MSVRQYVGARYVPKFFENSATGDSTWASNTAYEPLTIVTWNGNSYTSKKTVPSGVGNPSANSEYWASTGMFNAQVETLREQIEEIAELAENNEARLNRNVVLIGDSYFEQSGSAIKNWLQSATTATGGSFYSATLGGAGFVGNAQGKNFNDLFTDALALVTNTEIITDVVIAGGCNDTDTTATTISSAKDALIARIKSAMPHARIHIFCIGGFINPTRRNLLYNNVYYVYTASNDTVCIYPDAILPMLVVEHFTSDGVHPTANGCFAIAGYMVNKLFGGSTVFKRFGQYDNFTLAGGSYNLVASGNAWTFYNNNDTLQLPSGGITAAWNTGFTYDMGTVTSGFAPEVNLSNPNAKAVAMKHFIPVIVALKASDNVWDMTPAHLSFAYNTDDGSVHMVLASSTAVRSTTYTAARLLPFFAKISI